MRHWHRLLINGDYRNVDTLVTMKCLLPGSQPRLPKLSLLRESIRRLARVVTHSEANAFSRVYITFREFINSDFWRGILGSEIYDYAQADFTAGGDDCNRIFGRRDCHEQNDSGASTGQAGIWNCGLGWSASGPGCGRPLRRRYKLAETDYRVAWP